MKKKKRGKENKFNRWFLLSWKKVFFGVIVWIGAVILHNLTYVFITEILKIEIDDEPFFFVIAVIVIPAYFLIMIIYTLVKMIFLINKRTEKFKN
jgi:hypothetical protein